ncbi:MAG: response regulator transcription factor [Putridiphycobacter sp.]
MKLLIVEDDKDLLRTILKYFDSYNYTLEKAKTFSEGLNKVKNHSYDCVILDLNLPDGDGIALLEIIKKENKDTGVIILSANSSLETKVAGLEIGADDYLTKPFHLPELNARVKSVIRRNKFNGNNEVTFNEIRIDTASIEVFVNNARLKLTRKEYELLLYLVINRNRVLTRHSISEHIWGDYIDRGDSYDYIYSHLKNLRKKITDKGGKNYIQTIYGIGYKFAEYED